jgi:outer membrane receptor protein involved in Fe transport
LAFHTENQLAPASDRVGPRLPIDARDAWGNAVSPRGSLVLHALRGLDWTVSAGQGVRSSDAAALSEGEQAPFARVLALETGPSWQARFTRVALEARAFAFATRVSQDLLFDPAHGRNVPVGPSNRYGAALSARARVSNAHDTLASFTWANARAIERATSIFAFGDGTPLPFVPRTVLRVDHASRGQLRLGGEPLQLTAAGGVSWVGPRPLPLGAAGDSTCQLDLSSRLRMRFVELGVAVENVFDARNRVSQLYYASDFSRDDGSAVSMRPVRHFAAGTPRSFWFTLTIHLDDLELS